LKIRHEPISTVTFLGEILLMSRIVGSLICLNPLKVDTWTENTAFGNNESRTYALGLTNESMYIKE
jgi:hypothetical protein